MKCRKAYAIMLIGKNDESVQSGTQKAPVFQHRGFSIPLRQGGLCLRLATAYSSPSSHLQMQWQTTPVKTESKNDENKSKMAHPLSVPV